MVRAIKRNILRNQVGNKGLKQAWRRYQDSRGMVRYNPYRVTKKESIAKRIMRKIVKLSRVFNRNY